MRGRAALNVKQSSNKLQRHPYEPCYLYESGIRPLEQFPVKGFIWYQGESNAHNREAHERLFGLLVESWRKNWGDAELPFYFVQLSSIDLSLIHISEPTRQAEISYAVFCLKKKNKKNEKKKNCSLIVEIIPRK